MVYRNCVKALFVMYRNQVKILCVVYRICVKALFVMYRTQVKNLCGVYRNCVKALFVGCRIFIKDLFVLPSFFMTELLVWYKTDLTKLRFRVLSTFFLAKSCLARFR